jgi:hypothetical protein
VDFSENNRTHFQVSTLPSGADEVDIVAATNNDSPTLTLQWKVGHNGGMPIFDYNIRIYDAQNDEIIREFSIGGTQTLPWPECHDHFQGHASVSDGNKPGSIATQLITQHEVPELISGHQYSISIAARNYLGLGDYSRRTSTEGGKGFTRSRPQPVEDFTRANTTFVPPKSDEITLAWSLVPTFYLNTLLFDNDTTNYHVRHQIEHIQENTPVWRITNLSDINTTTGLPDVHVHVGELDHHENITNGTNGTLIDQHFHQFDLINETLNNISTGGDLFTNIKYELTAAKYPENCRNRV